MPKVSVPVGHGVAGVAAQVDDDLLNLVGIAIKWRQIRQKARHQLDVGREQAAYEKQTVLNHGIQVHRLPRGFFPTAKGQQLGHQLRRALGGTFNGPEVFIESRIIHLAGLAVGQPRKPKDAVEQVVEVMGNPASQPSHSFHFVDLLERGLQALALFHVAHDGDEVLFAAGKTRKPSFRGSLSFRQHAGP